MEKLDILFNRMDSWRHFPSYQLERRADLFFSLYLPEALEAKLGFPVSCELVPEFPVRIGTIYPEKPTDKSFKIDYLALSRDGSQAVFVELKTEGKSRRVEQDDYLLAAQKVGLPTLLQGLLQIFRATQSKRKYFCLLKQLEQMNLLVIPAAMHDLMNKETLQGAHALVEEITVTCQAAEAQIVYVQPQGEGEQVISFEELIGTVSGHQDALSRRFAQSLAEWAGVQAGRPPR